MSAMQNLPTNFNLLSPVGFRFQLSRFPEVTYFCQSFRSKRSIKMLLIKLKMELDIPAFFLILKYKQEKIMSMKDKEIVPL